jgi:hypothetical protein
VNEDQAHAERMEEWIVWEPEEEALGEARASDRHRKEAGFP